MVEIDSRQAAAAHEKKLVQERRQAAEVDAAQPTQGLALSGGGIRSATFCFGLLRGLAQGRALKRFDYLSTVSGGGYIGAALGRLYQGDQKAEAVQERLGDNDTVLLWWLRNNGRYLTPAGARDMLQALAYIVRNMFSSHFEVALLMLLGASFILLPYVPMGLYDAWGNPDSPGWPSDFWERKGSIWWMLMTGPLFAALHFIFRYWYCREWRSSHVRKANLGGAVVAAYCGISLLLSLSAEGSATDFIFKLAGAALLTAPLGAAALSLQPHAPQELAALRLAHTNNLGTALLALAAFALFGLLDYASCWLIDAFDSDWKMPALGAAGLTLVLTVLRSALPPVLKWLSLGKLRMIKPEQLLNAVGITLILLLALSWMTALQMLVRPHAQVGLGLGLGHGISAYHSAMVWAFVLAATLAFSALTAQDVEVLNLSSLHNFYRARIERAYVSVGNYAPEAVPKPDVRRRFSMGSPLQPGSRRASEAVARLIEPAPGDDIALANYRPHVHGGPIHLMSCCINQSVDDRTGNYNADRLGIALTMSSLGAEIGTGMPTPLKDLAHEGSDHEWLVSIGRLSRWVAISGAAASSGMGSQTSPGLAALLFLSGLRLGYWSPKLLPPDRQQVPGHKPVPWQEKLLKWTASGFPKPSLVIAELIAHFPGLRSTAWYVSDGGHFENTAVYALLKRELDVVLMADCGADPLYKFEDLENLARKAVIDYGASIEFLDPARLSPTSLAQETALQWVGTRETLGAAASAQFLLLARIHYRNRTTPGVLIVAKPRRLADLPLEVTGYAQRHESFPQQSTGDQFFEEEQWEAYHQLGLRMGRHLTPEAIAALRALALDGHQPAVDEPLVTPSAMPATAPIEPIEPLDSLAADAAPPETAPARTVTAYTTPVQIAPVEAASAQAALAQPMAAQTMAAYTAPVQAMSAQAAPVPPALMPAAPAHDGQTPDSRAQDAALAS